MLLHFYCYIDCSLSLSYFFSTIGARVIMDRLVSVEDQKWFMKMLSELIEKHFNMSMGKDIIGHLDPQKKGRV